MKKLLLVIIAVLCGVASTYAQDDFFTPPDFRQIERNIQNSSSSFYYPRLMARFLAGDSTITIEEGRHLYFGYVYQPTYAPTDTSQYNRLLANVLSKRTLTNQDFNSILEYSEALLRQDPFNLRALNAKLLVHAQRDNVEEYMRIAWQRRIVQDAIVSTGDGMSERTPFFVIKAAHQYDILPFLGFQFGGEDRIVRRRMIDVLSFRNQRIVNFLSVAQNRFGIERLYFDVTPAVSRGGGS
jgi:hypothetical protein